MEAKRISVFCALALLFSVASALAEEPSGFVQRLEWTSDAAALEYQVEVENLRTHEVLLRSTEDSFVELSLSAGTWRYRVHALNFLGRETAASEWIEFEVLKANYPDIKSVEEKILEPEEGGTLELRVDLSNITGGSSVELVREKVPGSMSEGNSSDVGKKGSEVLSADVLYFDDVTPGKWRVKVTNPSGLSAESDIIEVEGRPVEPQVIVVEAEGTPSPVPDAKSVRDGAMDLTISAGGGIFLSLYDGQFSAVNNVTYSGQQIIPAASLCVGFLPLKGDSWKAGMELSALGTMLMDREVFYNLTFYTVVTTADIVYQHRFFSKKLLWSASAGAGVGFIIKSMEQKSTSSLGIDIGYSMISSEPRRRSAVSRSSVGGSQLVSETKDELNLYLALKATLAFVWIPFRHLAVEAGACMSHVFIPGMPTGFVTPFVAVGLRL